MNNLQGVLEEGGYSCVSFSYTLTNHIEILIAINDVEGRFLIDTGASNSFVSNILVDKFKMTSELNDDAEVVGIGKDSPSATLISYNNNVTIEGFEVADFSFALLDMDHINEALVINNANKLDGVIGGDFLEETKAVIDYGEYLIWFKN